MSSVGEQSQSFVVDAWLSVDESVRDALHNDFEGLLGFMSSLEQAKPVMLAMPSITEEPPPGGDAAAIRLRWVDIGGADALDAAAQVTELLRRISRLLPALGSGGVQVRSAGMDGS